MCADIGDVLSVKRACGSRDGSGHRALELNATGEENRAHDIPALARVDPIPRPDWLFARSADLCFPIPKRNGRKKTARSTG
jgi:hypothetical protein